ncbi:MAG: 4Fe-4S binding protein [Desulfobacterales bacterium]|nr:4Fe-4S binding protein [Desulfobacterales bacterium]MBF0398032.1 4Fe-4S binding protein [Desulfobacterales bacterium]
MQIHRIRAATSFIVFILFILIFFDVSAVKILLSYQFVNNVIFVLLFTLIFGRLYCSILCPLGIFQDIISKFSQNKKRIIKSYYKSINYFILLIVFISFVLGSFIFVNIFDPYSLFGRIITTIISPFFSLINNALTFILTNYDIYGFSPIKAPYVSIYTFTLTIIFFIIILIASLKNGRLYCNLICPIGALLGIVSKFSVFNFFIKDKKCISCKLCEKKCRAGCIDIDKKTIDISFCVGCFDCVDICPKSAITYALFFRQKKISQINYSKRKFLYGSIGFLAAFPLSVKNKELFKYELINPIIPPGSISIYNFASNCTGCNLCVSVCPTRVIKSAFMEYSILGLMQPVLDFNKGFCSYECTSCMDACPANAIMQYNLYKKRLIKIGEMKFFEKYCIVHTKKKDCGACAEVCPTHAVYMVKRDKLFYPHTREDVCIGCGACQFVCPTKPKSIVVYGLKVHKTAKPPVFDKIKLPPLKDDKDFPF